MNRILLVLACVWQLTVAVSSSPFTNSPRHHAATPVPHHTAIPPSNHLAIPPYNNPDITLFDSLWRQADSLTGAGLPNSALAVVEQVSRLAREEHNDPQTVKAILYRISLNSMFQEDYPLGVIREVRQEIRGSHEPVIQILCSVLAQLYETYYRENQYRIGNRSTVAGNTSDNPETWDANRLLYEIILHYRQSLSNETELQQIPLERYGAIVEYPTMQSGKMDPVSSVHSTLFDFLARRALTFFTGNLSVGIQSPGTFHPDNPQFFAQSPKFVNYPMQPEGIHARVGDGTFIPSGTDTLSLSWYAIRIYQSLARFHLNNKNPGALIDWELKRFSYVQNNCGLPDRESLYVDALRRFEQDYSYSPSSTEISFKLAQSLIASGETYKPLVMPAHQWDLKDALQVCTEAVNRFPESMGAKNCQVLIRQILAPALHVTAEYAIIPDQPALASLTWKNISSLFFRLVKADPVTSRNTLAGSGREELFKRLASFEPVTSWRVELPLTGDYQEHRTEFGIPSVEPGCYLLVASADSLFQHPELPFSYQEIWSSRISYVTRRTHDGGIDIYLLDRQTGLPMKQVFVEAYSTTYDNRTRQYVTSREGEYRSDEFGFFSIPPPRINSPRNNLSLTIHHGDDLLVTEPLYIYPVSDRVEREVEQTRFFTDRAIYRPGQAIFFKGIVLERRGDSTHLKPGKQTRVTFVDVNGQKIADQSFTSDEYGAFNGTFTAPTGVLPGEMRIFNESGSISISVEEYKRPTFEVTFEPVEGNFKLGEELSVKGKAVGFAGNPMDAGTVAFRVVRMASFPFRGDWWRIPLPSSPQAEIASGNLVTDNDGTFTISFNAIPDNAIPVSSNPVFTFQVVADVTDINGETRSATETISVGYTSLLINLSLPERVNLRSDETFALTTTNLNGRSTPAEVQVTLQRLSGPGRAFKPRQWETPDTMILSHEEFYARYPQDIYADDDDPASWKVESTLFSEVLNTARDSLIIPLDPRSQIPDKTKASSDIRHPASGIRIPGSYKLTLSATDPFGQKVEKVIFFTAFDPAAKRTPVPEINWFVPLQTSGEPGDKASFLLGTSQKEIRIIREIRVKDRIYSRDWITLKNQQKVIDIPIVEDFRGNFSVNFLFVCQNRVFQNSQEITVPDVDKNLQISIESFRNKLVPGAREEWKVRIVNAEKKGVPVSFLTTMYDRSLDIFRSNDWTFDLFKRFWFIHPWEVGADFGTIGGSGYSALSYAAGFQSRDYEQLNWFGNTRQISWYNRNQDGMVMEFSMPLISKDSRSTGDAPELAGMKAPPPPPMDGVPSTDLKDGIRVKSPENQHISVIPVRKDFRETAFFYPSLASDSSGNLLLKFTVPEALTSWKLLGLAYTRQLDYGLIEKEVITQKELMVFPNVPRFVRQGDTVVFMARIVNLSDHEISGVARLELQEAITMQPLNNLVVDVGCQMPDAGYGKPDTASMDRASRIAHRVSFTIPAGQSAAVSWTLAVPVSKFISLLQYTVTAQAGDFSDGETNTLPVLPNRMMVTESLPLPVNGKGTTQFIFDKLLGSANQKSLSSFRLTLEFASNPAWYAVQALPALDEKSYKNSDQIFGAFYANALASHIAESSPLIRKVFESWKLLTPDALLSNLEKNEDLKSAILQETPWVREAADETGNKRRLGLYFDQNNLEQHLQTDLRLLRQMQYPSGGWPWFEGMQENRIVTLNILTGLGRLRHLGAMDTEYYPEVEKMMRSALSYLDQQVEKEYSELQKRFPGTLNENHLTPFVVKYLYARSFFSMMPDAGYRMPDDEGKLAQTMNYFTGQAKKYWLKQELSSQAMIALALHRSGDEVIPGRIMKSLSEKALRSPELGLYWAFTGGLEGYQAPVESQVLMMEAFDEVTKDQKSVDEMKIWLLKQKQTQMWKTRQATTDACYALLLQGTELLSEDPGVTIRLGDTEVDPSRMADLRQEAGTGYFRLSWTGDEIKPEMGNITVTKSTDGIAWGALYWQYFENLDQITTQETPLAIEKEIFREENTEAGPVLIPIRNEELGVKNDTLFHHLTISPSHHLEIGDKLKVRLIVTVDRAMDFVHLKDLRAAGLEPLPPSPSPQGLGVYSDGLSGYRYQDGLGYYQSTTDLSTNFFFDHLPKGTWVFEYPLVVNNAGDFSTGIATIQCMYAPEFSAHSEGSRIKVGG